MRDDDDATLTSSTSSDPHKTLGLLSLFLRLIVIPFSAASLWIMVKNNQVNDSFGKLEFSNLSGFKYLVWINAISAGYAFTSAIFSYLKLFNSDWLIFLLDQVTAYFLVTSVSAVAEILYLAHEGDREVSWSEVCSYYGSFCRRTKLSLVFHFMALLCFLALSLISAYRAFSKFEAPSVPSKELGGDVE